jgi:hypothetical protein
MATGISITIPEQVGAVFTCPNSITAFSGFIVSGMITRGIHSTPGDIDMMNFYLTLPPEEQTIIRKWEKTKVAGIYNSAFIKLSINETLLYTDIPNSFFDRKK